MESSLPVFNSQLAVEDPVGKRRDGRENNSGKGKKKIVIEKIEKKEQRMVTFSKRRKGLFNKCREFHCLTETDIAAIVSSPAGQAYAYGSGSVEAVIDRYLRSADRVDNAGNVVDELGLRNRMMIRSWLEVIENEDDVEEDDEELEQLFRKKRELEKIKNDMVKMIEGLSFPFEV